MPKGCQLDASPRSTGPPALTGLAPCNLSPPRPTFTSRRHSPSDVLRSETVALAWFSPERWCSPCNVEHFARATIPARNPLRPVLKVQLLEGILRSWSLGKQTYVRADVRMDSPMFWAAVGTPSGPPATLEHDRGREQDKGHEEEDRTHPGVREHSRSIAAPAMKEKGIVYRISGPSSMDGSYKTRASSFSMPMTNAWLRRGRPGRP